MCASTPCNPTAAAQTSSSYQLLHRTPLLPSSPSPSTASARGVCWCLSDSLPVWPHLLQLHLHRVQVKVRGVDPLVHATVHWRNAGQQGGTGTHIHRNKHCQGARGSPPKHKQTKQLCMYNVILPISSLCSACPSPGPDGTDLGWELLLLLPVATPQPIPLSRTHCR
jgi:hypothetical protein